MTEAGKAGLPRPMWLAGLGLGVALVLGTCALRRGAEPFKEKVNAMAQDLIREHWGAMRQAVGQIGTDEGAKAFYASNPGLSPRVASEIAFLELVRSWRPLVQSLPEALPALETRDLSYVRKGDQTEMSYRIANGTFIFMKWSEDRLVEMRIY